MAAFAPTEVTDGSPLAWVSQGLVLYVRGSWGPCWDGLLAAWRLLAGTEFAAGLKFARCSDEMEWTELGRGGFDRLGDRIADVRGGRPFWRVEVVNRTGCPDASIEFADLHLTVGRERASYLRLRLPPETPAESLLRLVLGLLDAVPLWSGTAGYQFSAAEDGREVAYDQVWAWARRYWGVEVVNPQLGSWDALKGLLGVNWLTLVGSALVAGSLTEAPPLTDPAAGVHVFRRPNGLLLRAGALPLLGDLNRLEELGPYIAAARMLEPALIQTPTGFFGMFTDHGSTGRWVRRFLDPGRWLEPQLG